MNPHHKIPNDALMATVPHLETDATPMTPAGMHLAPNSGRLTTWPATMWAVRHVMPDVFSPRLSSHSATGAKERPPLTTMREVDEDED